MRNKRSTSMSSLSTLMQALEKDSPHERIGFGSMTPLLEPHDDQQDDSDNGDTDISLRAPPCSLRSDSELEMYFRTKVEKVLSTDDVTKLVTNPATEPIVLEQEMSRSLVALKREYEMDTWKMYRRIQMARRSRSPVAVYAEQHRASKAVVVDKDLDDGVNCHSLDMSQHDDLDFDTEPIFELELDE